MQSTAKPTNDVNNTVFKDTLDIARHDIERFRHQATQVFANFEPADRRVAQAIDKGTVGMHAVLAAWESQLLPIRKKLTAARTADALQKAVSKHLDMDLDAAKALANQLTQQRCDQLVQQCILGLYPKPTRSKSDAVADQRLHATTLLNHPDAYIADFKSRYERYIAYRQIAAQQHIAIYDPHAPWLVRKRSSLKVTKQRRISVKQARQRLLHISAKLGQISAQHNGLVGQIIAKKWDAASIMSLKNTYEKHLLHAPQPVTPTQRLAIFDEVTGDFINQHIQKLISANPQASLALIKQTSDDVSALLIKIFDLTNAQKNEIVLLLKEHRDLIAEQQALLSRLPAKKQER